jgi:23S rRNA pseudouridine955/2504/2580 synthase
MHQIRKHCASIGHPIVMDDRYGDFAFNRQFRRSCGLKRQFLHAMSLALRYKGRLRKWTAPLPQDLKAVLIRLEAGEKR